MKKSTGFKANEDTRIWCEYCRIFVYNNRINREKHDSSPQHQANFKKKVESIRREEEEKKRLQKDLVTKPATTKSFYNSGNSSASSSSQNQPTNILSLKSSSTPVEKKQILGLSTLKSPVASNPKPTSPVFEHSLSLSDKPVVDIKSTASDLKRKIKEDEKLILEPVELPVSVYDEDVPLESLSMFKKKKTNK
jgi:hypothetical protein